MFSNLKRTIIRAAITASAFVAVTFVALSALAQATIPADPTADPLAFLNLVKQAIAGKQWALVATLAVIGLVALIRYGAGKLAVPYAGKWIGRAAAFFTTDRGGAILTLLVGVAGALVPVFAGGVFTVQAILDGVILGITSAGGYVMIKKIIWPSGVDRAQFASAVGNAAGAAAGTAAAADPAAALAAANAKKP